MMMNLEFIHIGWVIRLLVQLTHKTFLNTIKCRELKDYLQHVDCWELLLVLFYQNYYH